MQKAVVRHTLYEQAFEQIKSQIAQGVYKRGDRLPPEKQLMEQMQISRITIREALRMLNDAGIISTRQGYGSVVLLDGDELFADAEERRRFCESFLNSTRARIIMEPGIAKEAARIATDKEIELLGRCARGEAKEENFHRSLVSILKNPVLEQWLEEAFQMETSMTLTKLVPLTQQRPVSAAIEDQHMKIYTAIRDRQEDYAFFYMKEHLEFVLHTHKKYFDLLLSS